MTEATASTAAIRGSLPSLLLQKYYIDLCKQSLAVLDAIRIPDRTTWRRIHRAINKKLAGNQESVSLFVSLCCIPFVYGAESHVVTPEGETNPIDPGALRSWTTNKI